MKLKRFISIILLITLLINSIIPLIAFAEEDTIANEEVFFDDFSGDSLDTSKWLIAEKAWGGNNGGVVPENVSVSEGILKLEGHGDYYTGDVEGINRKDGTRTGAAIATRDYFGSGSYEVVAKVAPEIGACSAIWTFEYEEYYKGDEKYEEFGATGSYYAVNHEIDIEMPGRAHNGAEPSYEYALCNTWTGEKGGEYKTSYTKLPYAQNDGEFHKYRFDWHTGDDNEIPRVEFYFDDELIVTNYEHIPTNEGRLWIGLWFPNGWAGIPEFDTAVFEIDYVKIIPFHEAGDTPQNETYAKHGWAVDSFPENIEKEHYNHIINGDFSDGKNGWTLNGGADIKEGYGSLTSGSKTDSLSQIVSIEPKMTYTITADVVTDGTAVTIGAKKTNGEGDTSVTVTESGKVVLTFTTPSSVKEMKAYIEVLRYQTINNEVKVDNVTLCSGKDPVDDEDNEEVKQLIYSINLNKDKEVLHSGDVFTVTASINEIETNNADGIIAFLSELKYDKNILEIDLDSLRGLNTWNISNKDFNIENDKFVIESEEYISQIGDIFEVDFRVKDDIITENTSIKISNIEAGTGNIVNGIIYASDAELDIDITPREPEDKITSEKYNVGENYITKINANTKVKDFIENVETENELVFTDSNGKELEENDLIKTGTKLKVGKNLNYELSVIGDLDGDGVNTVNDLARIKLHLIKKIVLTGSYLESADLDNNEMVNANDLAVIKLMLIS